MDWGCLGQLEGGDQTQELSTDASIRQVPGEPRRELGCPGPVSDASAALLGPLSLFRAPHEEHWGYSGQEPPGAPGKWSANPVIDGNGFSKSPFL